jgi:hypothetical protein
MLSKEHEPVKHETQIRQLIKEFVQEYPEYADKQELVFSVISFQFRYMAHRIKLGAYEKIRLLKIGSFEPIMAHVIRKDDYYGTLSRRELQLDNKHSGKKNSRSKKNLDQGPGSEEA